MRIPGIDPPKVTLRYRRNDPMAWWRGWLELQGKTSTNRVYVPDVDIVGPWTPPVVKQNWYAVVLPWCLNWCRTLDERKSVVRAALDLVDPGGVVIAVARACDSGVELAELMVTSGVAPDELGVSNLSSKEIVVLQPSEACFLAETMNFSPSKDLVKDKARFLSFARNVRRSSVEPDIRMDPQQITTRLLSVGFVWQKQD